MSPPTPHPLDDLTVEGIARRHRPWQAHQLLRERHDTPTSTSGGGYARTAYVLCGQATWTLDGVEVVVPAGHALDLPMGAFAFRVDVAPCEVIEACDLRTCVPAHPDHVPAPGEHVEPTVFAAFVERWIERGWRPVAELAAFLGRPHADARVEAARRRLIDADGAHPDFPSTEADRAVAAEVVAALLA